MKRIPFIALLAVCLLLGSRQQASAWSKFNFGVGLNLGWEGGGNSILWGAIKGAPSPGQGDGYFPGNFAPAPGHAGMGFEPSYNASPMMAMPAPAPMPQVQQMPQMPRAEAQPVGYFTYPSYPTYYNYPQSYYYSGWYGW